VTVVYERFGVTVHAGDCLDVLAALPEASVHAVVTDPPYGLEFMGKEWDNFRPSGARFRTRVDGRTNPVVGKSVTTTPESYVAGEPFQVWCTRWATECLRVLKPGGHMLAFGGSRTWHRLAAAVEDAGFELRDSIAWLYASGFPKSLDVSKAIDKAAGAEREVVGRKVLPDGTPRREEGPNTRADGSGWARPWQADPAAIEARAYITAPATDASREWQGWGTALKPAFEPIVVARKPLAGTVAANVLEFKTGALNIDECRVAGECTNAAEMGYHGGNVASSYETGGDAGRWPSNVVISHAPLTDPGTGEAVGDACADGCVPGCPVADLNEQAGVRVSGSRSAGTYGLMGYHGADAAPMPAVSGDAGGASRFFPVFRFEAKAPASERPRVDGLAHPTVKPLALMRWLVRLVTPPGGAVLDPFLGSGTTAQAARAEGFRCIGVEREETYLPLIRARLDAGDVGDLFGTGGVA
jgi:DNA modification methylase